MASRRTLLPLGAALLAALSAAGGSGLLVRDAAAQIAKKPDDDDEEERPLVLVASNAPMGDMIASHSSHRSHSSHQSHSSHVSGGGGGWSGGGSYSDNSPSPVYVPPPAPPKPAAVSFVAFPGGQISIDGVPRGIDTTGTLTLKPGTHSIKVENRFLGNHETTVTLSEGQSGIVSIDW